MHPNRKFQLTDRADMAAIVRSEGFGTLTVQTTEGLRAVHVPVLLDGERLRFHVSRGNAVHAALQAGAEALFVATGAHAYVSPDWYGLDDRVPTWNYVAVEMNGPVRALSDQELVTLLDAISAEQETKLAPKTPWGRGKMTPGRFESLCKAIAGFELEIREWRGTAKIDQDKPVEVRARIGAALRERGDHALAALFEGGSPPHLGATGNATKAKA
jgi:transcriptional regulator